MKIENIERAKGLISFIENTKRALETISFFETANLDGLCINLHGITNSKILFHHRGHKGNKRVIEVIKKELETQLKEFEVELESL